MTRDDSSFMPLDAREFIAAALTLRHECHKLGGHIAGLQFLLSSLRAWARDETFVGSSDYAHGYRDAQRRVLEILK